jgi:hypothetical protein
MSDVAALAVEGAAAGAAAGSWGIMARPTTISSEDSMMVEG